MLRLVALNVSHLQVDDCIAKFLYMKGMTGKVKQLKAEGKPMPKDFQQLEKEFGEGIYAFHCNAILCIYVSRRYRGVVTLNQPYDQQAYCHDWMPLHTLTGWQYACCSCPQDIYKYLFRVITDRC